jgi:hypothetical protein
MRTGGYLPGVKPPEREADHSSPSSAEVKNAWSYTSTLSYIFMAWCLVKYRIVFMAWYLVKHRDNFILPLPYLTAA